jgi:CxxC motif-containing protein (DUF1111 family)
MMQKTGLIAAIGLTLASIAATATEMGIGPLGGDGTRPIAGPDAFTFQLSNSPRQHPRPFSFGNRLFNTNWVQAPASVKAFDGLGPMFNRVSCSGCHTHDGRGQPPASAQGPMDSMLFRISIPGRSAHGGPAPVPNYGDQLSERAIPGLAAEGRARISYTEVPGAYADGETYSLRKPSYEITEAGYGALPKDTLISPRVAPQMIGLGLLQAVSDTTLLAMADPDDRNGDGVSGRTNMVWDKTMGSAVIGRFGWKANQPSLRQQNADAAAGDLGLTTSLNAEQNCTDAQTACLASITGGEPEISDEFLDKLTLYTMTIAVPAQRDASAIPVRKGFTAFQSMGCAACHRPTLKTAAVDGFPEISNQQIHPFTDLLLHDMGDRLADNRPDFAATGHEWRTPPLWGLGLVPAVNEHDALLHDGRARGFAEAILWHGGEAERAKENFRTAPKETRDALIAFLKSL